MYSLTRRVQGRLNDLGLLCAVYAERDPATGQRTEVSEALVALVARYARLFNVLLYASVSTRFAPLKTPQGLNALVLEGLLTSEEKDCLLNAGGERSAHNTVTVWLSLLMDSAVADGRLGVSVARSKGTSPIAVQMALQSKINELRATYATMPDELSGRMPLAYIQLVQILTDLLILSTPLALLHSVGSVATAVCGTAVRLKPGSNRRPTCSAALPHAPCCQMISTGGHPLPFEHRQPCKALPRPV